MGIFLTLVGLLVVVGLVVLQVRSIRPDRWSGPPPLVIPLSNTQLPWEMALRPAPRPSAANAERDVANPVPAEMQSVAAPLPLRVMPEPAPNDQPAPSETVRFQRPDEEPIQLLPGRLEVVSGDMRREEIRLVRIPGRPAELTLGRDPSESVQHVTLRSSTVSRQHARIAFVKGDWVIMNLSRTNPVVINNEELSIHNPVSISSSGPS